MANSLYVYHNASGSHYIGIVAASQGAADTALAAIGAGAPGGDAGVYSAYTSLDMSGGFVSMVGPLPPDSNPIQPGIGIAPGILPAGLVLVTKVYPGAGLRALQGLNPVPYDRVKATGVTIPPDDPRADLYLWATPPPGPVTQKYKETVHAVFKMVVPFPFTTVVMALIDVCAGRDYGDPNKPEGTALYSWVVDASLTTLIGPDRGDNRTYNPAGDGGGWTAAGP